MRPGQTAFLSAARRREGTEVCYSVKDSTAVGLRGGDDGRTPGPKMGKTQLQAKAKPCVVIDTHWNRMGWQGMGQRVF